MQSNNYPLRINSNVHNNIIISRNGQKRPISFPSGIIVAWFDSELSKIPNGWTLCDGGIHAEQYLGLQTEN